MVCPPTHPQQAVNDLATLATNQLRRNQSQPNGHLAIAGDGAYIFGFNGALPYLEQWAPGSEDIWNVVYATAIGALVGAVLLLDITSLVAALICTLGCCGAVALFIILDGMDLNMTTVPVIMLAAPLAFEVRQG